LRTHATLVTSNLPFAEWTEVLGSVRLTGAVLDRLAHHVHILEMNGESFRLKNSWKKKDPGTHKSVQPGSPAALAFGGGFHFTLKRAALTGVAGFRSSRPQTPKRSPSARAPESFTMCASSVASTGNLDVLPGFTRTPAERLESAPNARFWKLG
jgi:hypothetical protein